MEYSRLPMGCYFHPTNKDLISFLAEKLKSDKLPPCIVPQKLYGEQATEPWKLFRGKVETEIYFFTSLGRKTPNGSKFERTTGHGTWKGQASTNIKARPRSTAVIGNKKNYRFEFKKGFEYSITGCLHPWRFVMHEYSLPDNELDVICKIIRYPQQKSNIELEELLEEEAQVDIDQSSTDHHHHRQGHRPLEPSSQNPHLDENPGKRSRVSVHRPLSPPPSIGNEANNKTAGLEELVRTTEVMMQPASSSGVGNLVRQYSDHQVVNEHLPSFREMMTQPLHAVWDDGSYLLQPFTPQLGNVTTASASSSGNSISAMPSLLRSLSFSAQYVLRDSPILSEYNNMLPSLPPPPSVPGEVVIPNIGANDDTNLNPRK